MLDNVYFDGEDYQISFRPLVGGVPYAGSISVDATVECSTGRVERYSYADLPLPPAPPVLTAAVLPNVAYGKMVAKVLALRPNLQAVYCAKPFRLGLWAPPETMTHLMFAEPSLEWQQAIENRRSMLVYWMLFWNEPDPDRITGSYMVYSDALTGKVVAIEGGEGFFGSKRGNPAPFRWDIGPMEINVSYGEKTSTVKNASVELSSGPTQGQAGVPILVHFGRASLRCRYLPKSGLLLFQQGVLKSYGKPSPALEKVLGQFAAKSR